MKRVLLVALFFMLLFTCEDQNERFCWECLTTSYDYYIQENQEPIEKSFTDTTIVRYFTEFDILLYEKERTVEPYSITTGGTHLRWTTCRCYKKE